MSSLREESRPLLYNNPSSRASISKNNNYQSINPSNTNNNNNPIPINTTSSTSSRTIQRNFPPPALGFTSAHSPSNRATINSNYAKLTASPLSSPAFRAKLPPETKNKRIEVIEDQSTGKLNFRAEREW